MNIFYTVRSVGQKRPYIPQFIFLDVALFDICVNILTHIMSSHSKISCMPLFDHVFVLKLL